MAGSDEIRSTRRPTPGRDDEAVKNFLEDYGLALSTARSDSVAQMWEAPALVIGHSGVILVKERAEVERFFAGARDQYVSRGVTGTRPEILRLSWVSDRIAVVDVRWWMLNQQGERVGDEVSTYTLRRDDSDALKIRVALTHEGG